MGCQAVSCGVKWCHLSLDPEVVIGLYPHLLPSDRRRMINQSQPTRPPTLSGEHLAEGVKHLITYLTQVTSCHLHTSPPAHPHIITSPHITPSHHHLSTHHTLTHTHTHIKAHTYTWHHMIQLDTLDTALTRHDITQCTISPQRRSTEKQTLLKYQKDGQSLTDEDAKKLVGKPPFHTTLSPFHSTLSPFHTDTDVIYIPVERLKLIDTTLLKCYIKVYIILYMYMYVHVHACMYMYIYMYSTVYLLFISFAITCIYVNRQVIPCWGR